MGNSANEMDGAWACLQTVTSTGPAGFVNLMKTYGISPSRFVDLVGAERFLRRLARALLMFSEAASG